MHITLTPMRTDDAQSLTLSLTGETLDVNGQTVDLSQIAEGEVIEADTLGCPSIIGFVRREEGDLHLTLILPHGANAPEETLFPAPLEVTVDGPVTLPPYTLA